MAILLALLAGAGLITHSEGERALAEGLAAMQSPPVLLDAPGRLLAWTGGVVEPRVADVLLLLLPLLAVPLLLGVRAWLPAAWESGLNVSATSTTSRSPAGAAKRRRWPAGVGASLQRKDLLAALRVHTNIGALGLFTAVAVIFVTSQPFDSPGLLADTAPPSVSQMLLLLNGWFILVMLVASVRGASWISDETSHYDLIAAAPLDRRALLWGKLPGMAAPFVWLLVVVLITARAVLGADAAGLAGFVGIAVPSLLATLGLALAVGSFPWLQGATDSGGHARRVVIMGAAVIALFMGLMKAGFVVRSDLFHHYNGSPGRELDLAAYALRCFGLLWGGAAALFAVGLAVAHRNLERLLAPRD